MAFFFVAVLIALWVSGNPEVQSSLKTPSEIEELVNHDFASYYSENPAGSFALQVWVNNSWVAVAVHRLRDPARHADPVVCCSRTHSTSA